MELRRREANCLMQEIITLSKHYKNPSLDITAYYDEEKDYYFYELTNIAILEPDTKNIIEEVTGLARMLKRNKK